MIIASDLHGSQSVLQGTKDPGASGVTFLSAQSRQKMMSCVTNPISQMEREMP